MLLDYKDTKICELLEFGFHLEFWCNEEDFSIATEYGNTGITKERDYPNDMRKYLLKESKHQAILGPFNSNPFSPNLIISPLNSVPKKESSEQSVIVDLSFPKGHAAYDFIDKDFYLGDPTDLVFPKVDDFVHLIKSKGRGCLVYKRDLLRAYR